MTKKPSEDYLDREMFGGDRFEPCSPPDFYCDGGCKLRFETYRKKMAIHGPIRFVLAVLRTLS